MSVLFGISDSAIGLTGFRLIASPLIRSIALHLEGKTLDQMAASGELSISR